jgi:hypothetical protein
MTTFIINKRGERAIHINIFHNEKKKWIEDRWIYYLGYYYLGYYYLILKVAHLIGFDVSSKFCGGSINISKNSPLTRRSLCMAF